MTGHYLYLGLHLPGDVTRISGQVITGLGFIGAGTIIVTKSLSVKGLTTAAGLWTSGVIGIAVGSGFYEGGVLAAVLVLVTETLLARLDRRVQPNAKHTYTLRCENKETLHQAICLCRDGSPGVRDLQIRADPTDRNAYTVQITLQSAASSDALLSQLGRLPGTVSVEEI